MIQRIQTIYMLFVILIMGALYYWFPAIKDVEGKLLFSREEPLLFSIIFLSIALAVITILSYKKRKLQFVLNRLNILANLILLGVFVFQSLNIPGENIISEKGIGMFLPVLSIVFLVLANKSIQKDENLVKSADRLR